VTGGAPGADPERVLVWPPPVSLARRVVRHIRGRLPPHDRYLLEQIIFPRLLSRADLRRILFVGCAHYTRHYPAAFADRELVTLDVDPAQARYGAATHIVDSLANLDVDVAPASLDAAICNGVIGWGLDDPDEIEQALAQCFRCLRPGGLLIVGWNDVEPHRPPVPLGQIESIREFEPVVFPPFPAPTYPTLTDLRHVFSFYARPAA
jgi:SAM-dependent methyltransferase